MRAITDKQAGYLEKIEAFRRERGYMPTVTEIAVMMGMSRAGGQYALKSLVAKGVRGLKPDDNVTRHQSATLRAIRECIEAGRGDWTTTGKVADRLGIHPNLARASIMRLARKGFISLGGKGRGIITLTDKGQAS